MGYFCNDCIYWINSEGGHCILVKNKGADVMGKNFDVIAPRTSRAGYEPNYNKINDTTSKKQRHQKVTTKDVI